MNFLEQLAAEWYEYQGYFVRTNIKFGPRKNGGYEGEIDVAAYNPQTGELIHIETSTDSDSWNERSEKMKRKFDSASKHYQNIFPFNKNTVKHVAILGFTGNTKKHDFGKIEVILIPDFAKTITKKLTETSMIKKAIPESYPLLRAIQFTAFYNK